MTLNLVKLCVGCDSPDDLLAWRKLRRAEGRAAIVHTRQTPKRAPEILDGGSLYWVFKGVILARQAVLAIDTLEEGGARRCEIRLEDKLIRTAPQPRRAFQGWRYFDAKEVPADLPSGEGGEAMPQALARELRDLGAW
jgi:hypothetical protein